MLNRFSLDAIDPPFLRIPRKPMEVQDQLQRDVAKELALMEFECYSYDTHITESDCRQVQPPQVWPWPMANPIEIIRAMAAAVTYECNC